MNYDIEHNEVDGREVDFRACGCIFDGENMSFCEDHSEAIDGLLRI